MRVKFKDKRQFESCWVKDISNGGIFLRTQTPVALFGRLTIVLELPNGDSVELQGEVVRVVPPDQAGPGVAAGMGVQFVDLTPAKRELLENYLGATRPEINPTASAPTVQPSGPPPAAERKTSQLPPTAALVGPPPAAPPKELLIAQGLEEMAMALKRLLWLVGDAAALADADYYQVLGVSRDARPERIKDACAALRALLDPSSVPAGLPAGRGQRFQSLQGVLGVIEATLLDPAQRARYDKTKR